MNPLSNIYKIVCSRSPFRSVRSVTHRIRAYQGTDTHAHEIIRCVLRPLPPVGSSSQHAPIVCTHEGQLLLRAWSSTEIHHIQNLYSQADRFFSGARIQNKEVVPMRSSCEVERGEITNIPSWTHHRAPGPERADRDLISRRGPELARNHGHDAHIADGYSPLLSPRKLRTAYLLALLKPRKTQYRLSFYVRLKVIRRASDCLRAAAATMPTPGSQFAWLALVPLVPAPVQIS